MVSLNILLYAGLAIAATIQKPSQNNDDQNLADLVKQQNDKTEFLQLLNALPDSTLHNVLHKSLSEYKDGVFDHDRTAFLKVHESDPPLATLLLSSAALDMLKSNLAKRQADNTTSPPSSSTPDTTPSSAPSTPSSSPPPSSPSSNPGSPTTSKDSSPPPASSNPPPSSPSSTPPPGNPGSPTSNSPPSSPAITYAATTAYTTTDSHGHTFITSKSYGVVSSVLLKTSTLPDGQVVVQTTYEFVTATGDNGPGSPGATHTGPAPGLQSGSANSVNHALTSSHAVMLGCIASFFWFL